MRGASRVFVWPCAAGLLSGVVLMGKPTSARAGGYVAGKPERSVTLTPRDSGKGSGRVFTPSRKPLWQPPARTKRRKNRNWALGGDRWTPAPNIGARTGRAVSGMVNTSRILRTIDRSLAELLEQRELSRQIYENGGGFARDQRDFDSYQRQIEQLQDRRMRTVRTSNASRDTIRRAERNWRATRGLRNRRYRGIKDTRWPVGDQAQARWLNDPSYDPNNDSN